MILKLVRAGRASLDNPWGYCEKTRHCVQPNSVCAALPCDGIFCEQTPRNRCMCKVGSCYAHDHVTGKAQCVAPSGASRKLAERSFGILFNRMELAAGLYAYKLKNLEAGIAEVASESRRVALATEAAKTPVPQKDYKSQTVDEKVTGGKDRKIAEP